MAAIVRQNSRASRIGFKNRVYIHVVHTPRTCGQPNALFTSVMNRSGDRKWYKTSTKGWGSADEVSRSNYLTPFLLRSGSYSYSPDRPSCDKMRRNTQSALSPYRDTRHLRGAPTSPLIFKLVRPIRTNRMDRWSSAFHAAAFFRPDKSRQ